MVFNTGDNSAQCHRLLPVLEDLVGMENSTTLIPIILKHNKHLKILINVQRKKRLVPSS